MARNKRPTGDAWDAIGEQKLDDLADEIDAMTGEEADRCSTRMARLGRHEAPGGGADEGDRREHARMGDWQAEARAKLDGARATFAAVRARRGSSRAPRSSAHRDGEERPALRTARGDVLPQTNERGDDGRELLALLDEIEALQSSSSAKKDPR